MIQNLPSGDPADASLVPEASSVNGSSVGLDGSEEAPEEETLDWDVWIDPPPLRPSRMVTVTFERVGRDRPAPEQEGELDRSLASPGTDGSLRERAWLGREVARASLLTDADRIRILRDLVRTADAIRRAKSPGELQRDEAVRRTLDEPGRARYRRLAERFCAGDET